jgi:hypothetical protein
MKDCAVWTRFHEEERAEEAAARRRAEQETYNEEKCKKIAAARLRIADPLEYYPL